MEKVWIKNYPKEVPTEISPEAYRSLIDIFEQNCQQFSTQPAFENFGFRLSFGETYEKSKQFANYLQRHLLLKKGERVAIILPNVLQYPVALFGILMAGGVVVNVNPLYTASEMLHQLKDADVSAVVILKNFAHVLETVITEHPLRKVIVTEIADLCSPFKRFIINTYVKHIKRMVPTYKLSNTLSFNDALSLGQALDTFRAPDLSLSDLAFLQYTGGTTGIAKGAMLTHGNMVANVLQVFAWVGPYLETGKEIMVTALPLYHIFCLQANLLTFMCAGTMNLLITNPRDLKSFLKIIAHAKFTLMTGVNTLFNAMLQHPDIDKVDFSCLKVALGGGMSVQKAVSMRWEALTGTPIIEGYGLTETSPVIAIHPYNIKHYIDPVGLPLPSTEVKILDVDGNELGFNEPGELYVKGPQVMKGYWRRETETKQVLTENGWLATGDIAVIDEKGFLSIVERKKDLIIVSGFNVYPNEIESVIAEMAGVKEVAVIGVKHKHSGEAVKAFITKQDINLTEEAVIEYCQTKLTRYKIPKFVEFRDQLPKTNVGKIMRRALKED